MMIHMQRKISSRAASLESARFTFRVISAAIRPPVFIGGEKSILNLLFLLAIVASAAGCATYQGKVADARNAIAAQSPDKAVQLLKPLAEKEGDDQLVYLLDYATALQLNGNYKESAHQFSSAEKIADIQDYHSLSKVTTSLLLSEEMVQYKGDDFEKVFINAMNAINYLNLGELDEALVETRRLNEILYKMKYEGKKNYDQNPFAFYLSAMIWEAGRNWDDAYIAYKAAYALVPDYKPLHEDLVRSAIRAQREDDVQKWKTQFPEVIVRPEWRDSSFGEIVLVYEQGWGPRKQPRPGSPRFPMLVPVYTNTRRAELTIEGSGKSAVSNRIFSLQQVAIKTLDDDFARLAAMRVAGVAAKAVVSDQIRQRNPLLGDLAFIALNATDRADLRQWSTLPESFQIARIPVKAGKYRVKVTGLGSSGGGSSESMATKEISVSAGSKTFFSWRSVK